jgi:KDO2-lipid IV(A) lauroyltransferase
VIRNLRRIRGDRLRGPALERAVQATFESYARYYLESFRLPGRTPAEIDEGHDVVGYEHVLDARRGGRGVILALPHLGGWEWSAFWLTRVERVPVTAVVEPLHPPELFEWFVSLRRALGMTIVSLGPDAARQVLAALRRNEVVCLLADRDLSGTGTEVSFFGERTTLPAGPATLALRSGAPLLPTAVYFKDGEEGVRGVVRPPLDTSRWGGGLRADVARVTQDLARDFEDLIRAAPEQWHLMQPNWPSDRAALARRRRSRFSMFGASPASS